MTDIVTFQNPGLIPMEAVTTMGVSIKDGDNAIGFFGTGLKYSIASLLRTGQRVVIWRGLERYDFEVRQEEVRGKEFGFIYMVNNTENLTPGPTLRLGFTTHLGARWEMWQIFRELHSNALDEGGTSTLSRLEPKDGFTTIWAWGTQIADAASKRSDIFLETTPLAVLTGLEVHPGPSSALYYRGVKVAATSAPTSHTYNLTSPQSLTEDRTLKDTFWANYNIMSALARCEDERIMEPVLTRKKGYEYGQKFTNCSEGFYEMVLRLTERHGVLNVHPNAVSQAETWAKQAGRVVEASLTVDQEREVEAAKLVLKEMGFPVYHPVIIADSLGPSIFGMAKNDTIYLARTVVDRGGRFLVSTMLEERLHLSHRFQDNSREFQDFLLDLAVSFACEARKLQIPAERENRDPVLIAAAPELEMPL